MNALFAELAQDHRDALVAYYLGQIVPRHTVPAGKGLVTEEDLYEFLLIDHQVTAKADSSRIATAMASVQQYIHAILNGMEPGYEGLFDDRVQQDWRTSKSEYAVWAANQMLQDYPENYIEPDLRLKQTSAFREFINDTNQSRISSDSVQKALHHYLGKFEHISNLEVLTGYIDGIDFRNADYYLIGRQNVEPHGYYWRKAEVRFGEEKTDADDDDYLSPTAWSEWLPVEIPKGRAVLHIRPLVMDGRLYVVWVEHEPVQRPVPSRRADIPGLYEEGSKYNLLVSYRTLEGSWSVPMSIALDIDVPYQSGKDAFVAFVSEVHPYHKLLVFGYGPSEGWTTACETLVLNTRFQKWFHGKVSTPAEAPDLAKILRGMALASRNSKDMQYPRGSVEYGRVSVVQTYGEHYIEGHFNRRIALTSELGLEAGGEYVLLCRLHVDIGYDHYLSSPVGELLFSRHNPTDLCYRHRFTFSPHHPVRFTAAYRLPLGKVADEVPRKLTFSLAIECGGVISANEYAAVVGDIPAQSPSIVALGTGGQFLDLSPLALQGLKYVRLNTLFAKTLVARAMVSVDALLGWDTQHIEEPPLPGSTAHQLMDFHGANGRYFWELFFHIPHAVAWRLHHEFDYLQAERWLHYLFNPRESYKTPGGLPAPSMPLYWSVRPLLEPGRGEYEVVGIADPDAIAYSQPVHYRKMVFTFYVRNLLANGDMLYRRLTRDALAEARLMYSRALSLLGPKPDNRMIGRWEPVTLEEAGEPDPDLFARIETQLPATPLAQVVPNDRLWLELLDVPRFRLPINTHLLDLWDTLHSRLHNLRNNLTLDGKPMLLPLYASPLDPRDLLRAQNSGNGLVQRRVGSLAPIPPYRFRAMLPRIQSAVDALSRFGDQVRLFHENRSRALLEELQQSHVLELSQFAIQLQENALEQGEAGLEALQASRRVIERRRDHYARLADENVSETERGAQGFLLASSVSNTVSEALLAAAGGVGMGAVIVTAFGGGHVKPDSALSGAAGVAAAVSAASKTIHEQMTLTEQYRRRHVDWIFQRDQAEAELSVSDEQITAQRVALEQSRIQLAMVIKAEEQAQHHYRYLKTRSANADLYQWLLSQLSTFYFQAYDAVVALCLNGEACWNYEMGDYKSRFIQPDVWFDNYYGLTAGEALRLQVLRMEAAYLKRFERRQEIVKTVSLKTLFDSLPGSDWATALEELQEGTSGTLAFELSPRMFDGDYPGHYLRQLVNVSVSIPAVLGAWQNVRAVLTQVSSRTVLEPDKRAMNALYDQPDQDTRNILYNPRASQSICLSSGLDDSGLFQLSFADERYLPFEGTGALSTWELHFPRHSSEQQQAILQNLTDIIVQVRYIALPGGPEFAAHVESLLDT